MRAHKGGDGEEMKKIKLRTVLCLALSLTFVFLSFPLTGCSAKGKTILSLGKHEITSNIYKLMLTQQKGTMAYAIQSKYGNYDSENFWGMTVEYATQKTNAQVYDEAVLEKAKNYLCALALFDELKASKSDFSMPESYTKNIETAIADFIEYDGGGSKTKFNSILSTYGVNITMLKEYLLMQAKAAYALDYLYGSDGGKIGDGVKDTYFEENYVACKQILIQKFRYIYETDKDGNEIYYSKESGNPLYDSKKIPALDENGKQKRDEHNNPIYCNEDGSLAYDTVNGERKIKVDSVTQREMYEMLDNATLATLREKAMQLTETAVGKDENGFDLLRAQESFDYSKTDKSNGIMYYATNVKYATTSSDYLDTITKALSGMKVGDVKFLESDLSYNIIMKVDLRKGAYSDENYKHYFNDEIYGVYDFITNLKNDLYNARIAGYYNNIQVNTEEIARLDFSIRNVIPNYYYPDPDVPYYNYENYKKQ